MDVKDMQNMKMDMNTDEKTINNLLVYLFNDILRIEEQALRVAPYLNLSMREFHVIQAVCHAGPKNTMSDIAQALGVTTGTITVSVNTLIKKGYLRKNRSQVDKRVVLVFPTALGDQVTLHHDAFHTEMTQAITAHMPPDQLKVLIATLETVEHYFNSKENE